jgi:hypothetical protein
MHLGTHACIHMRLRSVHFPDRFEHAHMQAFKFYVHVHTDLFFNVLAHLYVHGSSHSMF